MNVAVVRAIGGIGETILRMLEERKVPISGLGPFVSCDRSNGAYFAPPRSMCRLNW